MGIIRPDASQRLEIEEFRRMLLSCAAVHRRKDDDEFKGRGNMMMSSRQQQNDDDVDVGDKVVCVTSGVSFLGISIVKQLLLCGYYVRLIVDNEEDVEKLREMQMSGEMRGSHNGIEAVLAKLTEAQSLRDAFSGCRGVFHTAAFVDPAGVSGYSKSMVGVEVNASKNVIEACADSPTVKQCVLTSSLLACVWRESSPNDLPRVIDHNCWSDESVCLDKKLWYALGKLRAEKAAWNLARERGFKLATICPGLITGPEFSKRNPTPTIAYLKGAREMLAESMLATVDVEKLAKAHVAVYEAIGKTASPGRYICYDQVITSEDEVQKLARDAGIELNMLQDNSSNQLNRFKLSNAKLLRLMSRTPRCFQEC